ncbi:hypothetical protein HK099_002725 [Clydaea vesicula]|uniref:DSC E3 ubiquitin ligase complex subunit 3 C-terminal domain-containing protein n=1 Tax=Clydaea vesicula TaxID=447962 RepID=A0AAD5XUI3_9FUNG|nr:hypothetical protein HK099_002725 [Clydaea vesicula]
MSLDASSSSTFENIPLLPLIQNDSFQAKVLTSNGKTINLILKKNERVIDLENKLLETFLTKNDDNDNQQLQQNNKKLIKKFRFILNGKILKKNELVNKFNLNFLVLHCSITEEEDEKFDESVLKKKGKEREVDIEENENLLSSREFQNSNTTTITSDTAVISSSLSQTSPEARGFERLRSIAGLTEDEVNGLRERFHLLRDNEDVHNNNNLTNAEDEWIDNSANGNKKKKKKLYI